MGRLHPYWTQILILSSIEPSGLQFLVRWIKANTILYSPLRWPITVELHFTGNLRNLLLNYCVRLSLCLRSDYFMEIDVAPYTYVFYRQLLVRIYRGPLKSNLLRSNRYLWILQFYLKMAFAYPQPKPDEQFDSNVLTYLFTTFFSYIYLRNLSYWSTLQGVQPEQVIIIAWINIIQIQK